MYLVKTLNRCLIDVVDSQGNLLRGTLVEKGETIVVTKEQFNNSPSSLELVSELPTESNNLMSEDSDVELGNVGNTAEQGNSQELTEVNDSPTQTGAVQPNDAQATVDTPQPQTSHKGKGKK